MSANETCCRASWKSKKRIPQFHHGPSNFLFSDKPPSYSCRTQTDINSRRAVTAWTFSNVIAGSDSTGVVLRTAWFNLTAHPSTFHKLRAELVRNAVSRPYPKWSELQHLPYLDVCVLEASRLHPPFCLPLERVVPAGGVTICGRYFPAGTVVGMSAWVANRHKPTFGEDAEQWRPERWLEVGEEQRKKMEQSIMTVSSASDTAGQIDPIF